RLRTGHDQPSYTRFDFISERESGGQRALMIFAAQVEKSGIYRTGSLLLYAKCSSHVAPTNPRTLL
ncbi:hypothetical protein, partial [Cupriavidus sp. amp6]|uniref:hypothetical protein n=1 Tax=Cupriavidus sp. amp6 TaxID=388051 RepID=UPI001E4CB840